MIRGTMNLQLQEHRLATVYIDSIQQDFKQIKKLKASQRKVLKDFGLQEVIKEIETFINEQQQHVSANRLLGNTGQ
jgi:tRNA uridine 5-carbamoylmethylation protein Kti12